jgi:hypothetical protein
MSNVTYRATNQPVCASPIVFNITPVAPFWISEVLVYLNSSYPPPEAYGRIRAGSPTNYTHLTIFVDQTIFNQICGCLGGSVDISIDYTDTLVTNVSCAAEPLRVALARVERQLADVAATFHAVKKDLERRAEPVSDISELAAKKTGSKG